MLQWINRERYPDVRPPPGRLLLCRCEEWNDEGYQIARYVGKKFTYSEQANGGFDECVTDWAIFMLAD